MQAVSHLKVKEKVQTTKRKVSVVATVDEVSRFVSAHFLLKM